MILPTAWLIAFGLLPIYNPALYDPLWQPPSYEASAICSNYVPTPERCLDKPAPTADEATQDFFTYRAPGSSWWHAATPRVAQPEE